MQLDVIRQADVSGFPPGFAQCPDTGACIVWPFNLTTREVFTVDGWVPLWPPGVLPVPVLGKSTGLELHGGVFGRFVGIHDCLVCHLQAVRDQTGKIIEVRLAAPADVTLRNTNGQLLQARGGTMSFSNNGKWLVFDAPGGSHVRVNLETHELFKFGPPTDYGIGLDPAYRTAISNDGRFVAINQVFGGDKIRVYDLDACVPPAPGMTVGNMLVTGYQCQEREFSNAVRQQVPGYVAAIPREFIDEQTLVVYAGYREGGVGRYARLLVNAGGTLPPPLEYLALGDSYSSGEGAFNYRPGTDVHASEGLTENLCHQSFDSYPHQVARSIGIGAFASVACSGARMRHVTSQSQYSGDEAQALASFMPGLWPQIDFMRIYRPDKVTVGIVGNDIGFSEILKDCILPGTCYSTSESRRWLVASMRAKFWDLADLLAAIRSTNASSGGRKVYVVGYPQIVLPSGGSCALNVHLNDAEREFAMLLTGDLNMVIKAAADRAGVLYVDVEDAFQGARLCESSSPAVNGLTAGDDVASVIGNESFHPNRLGQDLLAAKVVEKTDSLSTPMPEPDGAVLPPRVSEFELLGSEGLGGGPTSLYVSLGPSTAFLQSPYAVELQGSTFALQPGATYTVSIQSDPVVLGSATADSTGRLSGTFVIPSSVGPGFHELHVSGPGIYGEPIDLFQLVLVGASPTDWDGNGVADSLQVCVFVEPSGVDVDRDGIDDACDGFIDNAPVDTTPPVTVASVTPGPNAAGWNRSDVSVALTATDDGSGVREVVYRATGALTLPETSVDGDQASIPVSAEGETTVTFFALDEAGNASTPTTLTVRLDKTPPTIATERSPEANAFGWNSTDVIVNFSCSDALSGIASCSPQTTLTSEGRDQSVARSATDLAGNEATATFSGINIDKTKPEITGWRTPGPNANGWNNTDVTVLFSCTDALSGVENCGPSPQVVSDQGALQARTGTVRDLAGNSAGATVGMISIDKTAPTITAAVTPPPNVRGWHRPPVTVDFACADALSGVGSCSPAQTLFTPGVHQVPGGAVDLAGNAAGLALEVRVARIVTIDVKPGSDLNSVGCRATNGELPVAILSSADFDATAVDADSVRFGKMGDEAAETHQSREGTARRHVEDANGDGKLDLVFHFKLGESGFSCSDVPVGAKEATVAARLTGFVEGIGIDGEGVLRLLAG